jgi:hypothetical protein
MDLVAKIDGMCEIVWIVDAEDSSLGSMSRLLPRLGAVVDTAGHPHEVVAEQLYDAHLDGVIAFTDRQLPLASMIGQTHGLAHNPPDVVDRLNNKFTQRSILQGAGIPVPAFRKLAKSMDHATLVANACDLSFPLVVKPLFGDSSRETWKIGDLTSLISLIEAKFPADRSAAEDFIAEEYLDDRLPPEHQKIGDYVSVESIVQDGRPVPLAITGKFPLVPPFRESGNFMPHLLSADEAFEVLSLSVDAALAIGVQSGALHTEIKFTADGPRVIEVNGRIGGGGIDSLYTRTHGRSLTELATGAALGRAVELVPVLPNEESGPFAYDFFAQPPMEAHRLLSISASDRILGNVGAQRVVTNKSPGDAVDWHHGSQDYVVQVGGVAEDRRTLDSVPETIVRSLAMRFA